MVERHQPHLDGLATGSAIFTVSAYSLVTFWQFQQRCTSDALVSATYAACYNTPNTMDLHDRRGVFRRRPGRVPVVERAKAKVFMGDVGSMAIGGVIVAMSILSRTEILALIIAGIFVIAPGSVVHPSGTTSSSPAANACSS